MAYTIRLVYFWVLLLPCLMFSAINPATARVTLPGSRVIYPAAAGEKKLQFTNGDNVLALIQVWLDSGNKDSTPDNADAPFIATPQIFRVSPHSGQRVRLMFTGKNLPDDRDLLFYLNFLQVPAIKENDNDKGLAHQANVTCHFGPGQCAKSSRTTCTRRFLRAFRVHIDGDNNTYWARL